MSPAAFVVDLDGTLVDSVHQHVLAWREALEAGDIGRVLAAADRVDRGSC